MPINQVLICKTEGNYQKIQWPSEKMMLKICIKQVSGVKRKKSEKLTSNNSRWEYR